MRLIRKNLNPAKGSLEHADQSEGIVSYPTEDTKKAQSELKEILSEYLWDSFTDYVDLKGLFKSEYHGGVPTSLNDAIHRMYELWSLSGRPETNRKGSITNSVLAAKETFLRTFGLSNTKKEVEARMRPNYNGTLNNIRDFETWITEFAHAVDLNSKYGSKNNIHWYDPTSYLGDLEINGLTGYDRPGHHEYMTHKILEPAIADYILKPDGGRMNTFENRVIAHTHKLLKELENSYDLFSHFDKNVYGETYGYKNYLAKK